MKRAVNQLGIAAHQLLGLVLTAIFLQDAHTARPLETGSLSLSCQNFSRRSRWRLTMPA